MYLNKNISLTKTKMGETGKVELGAKTVDRSKVDVPADVWPNTGTDGERTEADKAQATEYQNKIRDGVKKDLLTMKDAAGETLVADKASLVDTKVTARSGDTIGALAFAVDGAAISKARKATKEARKADKKAPEAPKDMALNWKSSVKYQDAKGTELVSCRLYEASFLGPKDVIGFEGGDKTKVVVTLNNEKSLKKVTAYAEKVKAEKAALDAKVVAYAEKLNTEHGVTLTVEDLEPNTQAIDGLKQALRALPVVEKALAQLKKKAEAAGADAADVAAYEGVKSIHLAEKDGEKIGEIIVLGFNGKLKTEKIAEYLETEAAK